jgi:hypothetical protein
MDILQKSLAILQQAEEDSSVVHGRFQKDCFQASQAVCDRQSGKVGAMPVTKSDLSLQMPVDVVHALAHFLGGFSKHKINELTRNHNDLLHRLPL